ncbi:MAG TPA: hypothetical protein VN753_18550 [Terracidiphilus sp.]|nr:hypothetical protein [Terracidiphilus sp.]
MANSNSNGKLQPAQQSGAAERAITIASGALLLTPVLRKRSIISWTAAAAGGALIYDGISGACAVSHKLGLSPNSPSSQRIHQSITIGKEAAELYALWRKPDTMTRLMRPWADVEFAGENHIRWSILLPMGPALSGEAIMVEDSPDEMVHWSTMPGESLQVNEWFHLAPAPQNRGTEVKLDYLVDFSRVPGGRTLRAISSFFDEAPHMIIGKVLHNFKALAETGEIPTLERNPSARSQNESQVNNRWRGDLV